MAANEGIEVIPIDTGEFKSAGAIGTKITDRQKADFQRIVDQFFADFVSAVARGRGMPEQSVRELADGRMFIASTEAINNGLVDAIQTFDETFAELREPAGSGNERRRRTAGALRARLNLATTEIQ
jgi:protease-4